MRSPLARAVVAAVLSALACICWAAQITVQPPGAGPWEVWIGPGAPGGKANFKSNGEAINLPLAGTVDEDIVTIYGAELGNLASKTLGDIDFSWKVTRAEFVSVAAIEVELTHNSQPLAAANVTLKSADRTQTQLLTPSQKGVLTFKNVRAGSLEVTVATTHNGVPVSIPKQTFRVELARKDTVPKLRVAIADTVDTVGATEPKPAVPAPAPVKEAPAASTVVTFLSALIGLGLVACLAYALWRYLPVFKPKIDEQLQKVGVQIPSDPEPEEDAQPAAPARQGPVPVQQIILDAPVVAMTPRMVLASTGQSFEISVGRNVLSRDPGHAVSLLHSVGVSRQHAEIERTDQGPSLLRDLGSTNGTFVNGVRIEADTLLKNGDRVQVGDTVLIVEGL